MSQWRDQWDRVKRYYERFQSINDGTATSTPTRYWEDDVHAFFQNCHHLKDWLINDPDFTQRSRAEIESHVSSYPLNICADICNGTKHLLLNRKPRSGGQPQLGRKTYEISIVQSLSGQRDSASSKMQIEIVYQGSHLDAFQLATQAMQTWKSLLPLQRHE